MFSAFLSGTAAGLPVWDRTAFMFAAEVENPSINMEILPVKGVPEGIINIGEEAPSKCQTTHYVNSFNHQLAE
jgi:hypothetical protein